MKKIFTLAVMLLSVTLFSASVFAAEPLHPNFGKVSIKSRSDAFIQVVIDGRTFNMDRSGFMMENLRPGRHSIQILQIDRRGWRNRARVIYSNTMAIRPWELLDININRFENVSVVSRMDPSDRYDRGGRYDRDDSYGHGDRDGRYGDRDGGYNHDGRY
jgi:hypothetical protein